MVPSSPSPSIPTSRRTLLIRLLLSLVLAGIFVWILRAGALPLLPPKSSLLSANVALVAVYVPVFFAVQSIRSFRWMWLSSSLASLPLRSVMRASFIAHASLVVLPLRMGEFVKPVLMRRYGASAAAVASTVGAERIIDGLCVGLMTLIGITFAPGHAGDNAGMVRTAARMAVGGFSMALVVLVVLYFWRGWVERSVAYVSGWFSPNLADRAVTIVQRFASGLDFLKDGRAAGKYVATTVFYWLLQIAGIWSVVKGCGLVEIGTAEIFAVTGVLALGFLLPAPPGFFGAFQAAYYAGLMLYLPSARVTTSGAAAVFYTYLIQITITLVAGVVCLWLERHVIFPPAVAASEPTA